MKITMLKTVDGKVDGVRMGPYLAGQDYTIKDDIADRFINSAMAEPFVPEPVPEVSETGAKEPELLPRNRKKDDLKE